MVQAAAPARRDRRLPGGPDVLRHAALQLRLSRRGGAGGRAHRRSVRALRARRRALRLLRVDGQGGVPRAARRTIRGARRRRGRSRRGRASCRSSSSRCSGVRAVDSSFRGTVTYHDSCHLLRGLGESRSPRVLLAGRRRRASWSSCPARTSAAASADRSRCGCPRCRRRSSTRSSTTSRATGADCLVACDGGCLMQMGGGLSRRNSRVRALHLAQVLAGDERVSGEPGLATPFPERAARRAPRPLPAGGARHRHDEVHRPPPRGLRRLPARARRSATRRARSRRRRSSASTCTSSGSPTTSSASAGTCTGRTRRRTRARSCSGSAATRASAWR